MFKDYKSLLNINWIYFFLLLIIFWIGEINLYSAAGGNAGKETIELLITNGADLNFIRERGGNKGDETPLDRANRKGRTEIAELHRTHGAKTSKELKAEAE